MSKKRNSLSRTAKQNKPKAPRPSLPRLPTDSRGDTEEQENATHQHAANEGPMYYLYVALFILGVGFYALSIVIGLYMSWQTNQSFPNLSPDYSGAIQKQLLQAGEDVPEDQKKDELLAAIDQSELALELDHANPHVAQSLLGIALAMQGKTDEAIEAYQKAIDFQPRYSGAKIGLAQLLAQKGEYAQALRHLDDVLRYDPNNPQAVAITQVRQELLKRIKESQN